MKRIVIISCYPSGQKEIDILSRCIDGFRNTDWHIMVVSHLPLPKEISDKVEFVIYDSNNTFLSPRYTPSFWMESGDYLVRIYNAGHTLPICRNMRAGISLARAMGYEQFVFTECDVLLSKSDANGLVHLMDSMTTLQRKMLFFKPEEYRDCGSYVYETLLFGGYTNYFLDTFQPPLDEHEWLTSPMGNTLELSFFEKFSKDEDNFLIVNDHSSFVFTNGSEINVLRYGLFNCDMLFNEFCNDEPVLFVMNSLILEEQRLIEVYKNNELTNSLYLGKSQFWMTSFNLDDSEIRVDVYNNDKTYLYSSKKYILNNQHLPLFRMRGVIKNK